MEETTEEGKTIYRNQRGVAEWQSDGPFEAPEVSKGPDLRGFGALNRVATAHSLRNRGDRR